MTKIENVPNAVPLDDEGVFYLSIVYAWRDIFPPALREFARLKSVHLNSHIWSEELSPYGLLASAYLGFAPLPTSYGRFITHAERVNKLEPHADSQAFRKDAVARENSAASEYGMSRGELKRLLQYVDAMAAKFGFESYDAVFNCKDEILRDPSPFAPADRETFAEGPLHLWDFAKAVSEHELTNMAFDTYDGWVLFVHHQNGAVSGHAIHPRAHRFGGFCLNPLVDFVEIQLRGDALSPILTVPKTVQEATSALAKRYFPDLPFEFMPPPMVSGRTVHRARMVRPDLRRCWTEA